MPVDKEPRYFFQEDYLRIVTKGTQYRIRGASKPVAEKKTTYGEWYDYNPIIQLVKPYRQPKVGNEEAPPPRQLPARIARNNQRPTWSLHHKRIAFERFRASLPRELPKHLEKFSLRANLTYI